MSDDVTFVAEVPSMKGSTRTDWYKIADALRARRGEWAIVARRNRNSGTGTATAYSIKNGVLLAFRPPGTFEATTRTENSEAVIYARYVGNGKDAS